MAKQSGVQRRGFSDISPRCFARGRIARTRMCAGRDRDGRERSRLATSAHRSWDTSGVRLWVVIAYGYGDGACAERIRSNLWTLVCSATHTPTWSRACSQTDAHGRRGPLVSMANASSTLCAFCSSSSAIAVSSAEVWRCPHWPASWLMRAARWRR